VVLGCRRRAEAAFGHRLSLSGVTEIVARRPTYSQPSGEAYWSNSASTASAQDRIASVANYSALDTCTTRKTSGAGVSGAQPAIVRDGE
jgi:hypothetical protein